MAIILPCDGLDEDIRCADDPCVCEAADVLHLDVLGVGVVGFMRLVKEVVEDFIRYKSKEL